MPFWKEKCDECFLTQTRDKKNMRWRFRREGGKSGEGKEGGRGRQEGVRPTTL